MHVQNGGNSLSASLGGSWPMAIDVFSLFFFTSTIGGTVLTESNDLDILVVTLN